MKFHATLKLEGKTATGIQVPTEIIESLGTSKRPSVRVTIKDFSYRTTVAPMGDVFMIPVSADIRNSAGIAAGDELDVDIELDTEPRTVEVPDDLAAALAQKPGVSEAFDALAFSKRKEFVRQVNDAKTPETRTRRIANIIDKLSSS